LSRLTTVLDRWRDCGPQFRTYEESTVKCQPHYRSDIWL